MLKRTAPLAPVLALAIASGISFAQEPEAAKGPEVSKFYKLEFVVKEVEAGKVLNTRAYSMTVEANATGAASSIRTGTKVPYSSGANQWNYADVGVNIDCRSVRQAQRDLSLSVSAEISSVQTETGASETSMRPIIRQNRWSSSVIVPLSRPTVLFSSDDPASKRQMQLELTANLVR